MNNNEQLMQDILKLDNEIATCNNSERIYELQEEKNNLFSYMED